ncbi:hypothetical protein BH24BAC1_BH24BAC1_27550 [soil metagenome]
MATVIFQKIQRNRPGLHSQIDNFLLVWIAVTFPFSVKINSLGIILLLLNWLLAGNLWAKLQKFWANRLAVAKSGIVFLYLFGLIYTTQMREGTFMVEKSLSLFLLPLVLTGSSFTRRTLDLVLLSFVGACFVATVVSYITVYFNYLQYNDVYLTFAQGHFRDNFASYLRLHPTYFTLYLSFSILVLFHFLLTKGRSVPLFYKGLMVLLLFYFGGTAILLSARMPLATLFFLLLTFGLGLLFQKRKFLLLGAMVTTLAGALYLAVTHPLLNKRFREVSETSFTPPTGERFNSTNLRVGILRCGIEGLEQAWLFGFGTGDPQLFLNQCYREKGYSPILYEDSLNVHNAYLQAWLTIGLAGFMWLLVILVVPGVLAYRYGYYLFLAFLLLIGLTCLTESLLNAQKGVVFFSFFYSLFAFHYYPRVGEWGKGIKKGTRLAPV